jgi:hypothetical protein
MFSPRSLWTIDDEDELNVHSHEASSTLESKVEDLTAHVDNKKLEQIEHSTPADAPLAPTIDTTDHAEHAEHVDQPDVVATEPLDRELTRQTDFTEPEPTLEGPLEEKLDPLSHMGTRTTAPEVDEESQAEQVGLSQHTTASSGQLSGHELARESADPTKDVIPVSQQTTASSQGTTLPLEKLQTPEEPRSKVMTDGDVGKESMEQV